MIGALIGLVAGFAARAIIPGRQQMRLTRKSLLGLTGSLLGSALSWLIFDTDGGFIQTASWLGSIAGAAILLGALKLLDDHRTTSLPQ